MWRRPTVVARWRCLYRVTVLERRPVKTNSSSACNVEALPPSQLAWRMPGRPKLHQTLLSLSEMPLCSAKRARLDERRKPLHRPRQSVGNRKMPRLLRLCLILPLALVYNRLSNATYCRCGPTRSPRAAFRATLSAYLPALISHIRI